MESLFKAKRKHGSSRKSKTRGRPPSKGRKNGGSEKKNEKDDQAAKWEAAWRSVPAPKMKEICKGLWPGLHFRSVEICLEQLWKHGCYANESVTAWLATGAEDASVLSIDVLRIRPEEKKLGSEKGVKEPSSQEGKGAQSLDPTLQITESSFNSSSGFQQGFWRL